MTRIRLVALAAALGIVTAPLAGCSDSSVRHMRVGQCIRLPHEETATTVETTGCAREHDAEVFHVTSAPDGDFPGADTLNKQAETECISAFDEYVGTDYLTSSLDATWMIPTKGLVGAKGSVDRVPGASAGSFKADQFGEEIRHVTLCRHPRGGLAQAGPPRVVNGGSVICA